MGLSALLPVSRTRDGPPSTSSVSAREIVTTPTTAERASSASLEELPIELPRPRPSLTTLTRESPDARVEVSPPWTTVSSPSSFLNSRRTERSSWEPDGTLDSSEPERSGEPDLPRETEPTRDVLPPSAELIRRDWLLTVEESALTEDA